MGYKFTATAAERLDDQFIQITIENTGVAYCPYKVEVCTSFGCGGDLSNLAPGSSVDVTEPATATDLQILFFDSPRINSSSSQKIRWSNVGASDTLELFLAENDLIFADGFEQK